MPQLLTALGILAVLVLVACVAIFGGPQAIAATPALLSLTATNSAPVAPWFGFLSSATGVGLWLLGNWSDVAQFVGSLIALYLVIRGREWNKLLDVAGQLAYDAAKLAYLNNAERRKHVADQLYERSGAIARRIFTHEQYEMAVETAWQLIAKPRVKAEKA